MHLVNFTNFIKCKVRDKMQENNIGKKILILGNGFDLAHGLPTSYADFLNFCKCVEYIFDPITTYITEKNFDDYLSKNWKPLNENFQENIKIIKDKLCEEFKNRKEKNEDNNKIYTTKNKILNEIHNLIKDNFWVFYFINISFGQNWIDFETEIKNIVEPIDKYSNNDLFSNFYDIVTNIKTEKKYHRWNDIECKKEQDKNFTTLFYYLSIKNKIETKIIDNIHTVQDFRDRIEKDLKQLIRALELYLSVFVEDKDIMNNIKPIEVTNAKIENEKFTFNFEDVDYVINFNYTNTYEKKYNIKNKEIIYVHGKCEKDRTVEYNTPVLGIDKCSENPKNTIFNGITKIAQRTKNNIKYEENKILNEIKKIFNISKEISEIHIFGHSLGIMDSYILKDFLSSESTSIIAYCREPEPEKEYERNEKDDREDKIVDLIDKENKEKKFQNQKIKYLYYTTKEITSDNQEAPK